MERANDASRVGLFCLTLLLVLFFSIHKFESRDFGWLLKTGEYIYENHQVPRADFYSFTVPGNKYIDSHWLFQLLLFVTYKILGMVGPALLVAGILLVTFSLMYFIGHDKEKYLITPVFMVAGMVMASERFIVRPHLITLLFLSVYFFVLEKYKKRISRMIFLLPLFQLLWVNMHGLFILGLILPAFYLGLAPIEQKLRLFGKRKEEHGLSGKWYGWLAVVLVIMICESFLSPYTVDLASYPLTLFEEVHSGANIVAASVAELSPPLAGVDLSRAETYFKWMIVISALCFLLKLRRLNLTHLFLFAAFCYLGLIARRNMDLFAVIATPIAAVNVGGFIDDLFGRFKQIDAARLFAIVQVAVSPLIMACMIYMISQIATDRYYIGDRDLTRFGFGVAKHAYPVKAANFVEAADLRGRMFNDPSDGGYLIWRFYPERKVYFDGRWEVYGDEFFENFQRICSHPSLFDERAAVMEIRYVLLRHSIGYLQRLIKHMIASPLWEPVYFDEISVIFVRNVPENGKAIERFGIDFVSFESEKEEFDAELPANIEESHFSGAHGLLSRLTERVPRLEYPFDEIARANFYLTFGYYGNARLLYERALRIYPDSEIAHAGLGRVYWKEKLYQFALTEFEAVDRLNPRSSANLANLGNLNLVIGRVDEAEEYFKRLKRLDRHNPVAPLQLGKIYARKGLSRMAARELRRALKLKPDLQEARELLRQIEQR